MYWKEEFDLRIETFSKNHIDATICKNKEGEWRFIGFYGEPDTQLRHEAWAHLRNLRTRSQAPWLCAGDFNEEILDRAVATNEWFSMFPNTRVHHIDVTTLDHKPLLINSDGMDCKQQRPFWFDQMWMSDPGCGATIEVTDQIEQAMFPKCKKRAGTKKKRTCPSQETRMQRGSVTLMKKLEKEINQLLDKEAQMWGQRAKVQWLKDGDRNTSRVEDIILAQIPRDVTAEMNHDLLAKFKADEVETALKQMAPLKSPRPDGMPPSFYQYYWSLVGNDVANDILYFLNLGNLPPSLFKTPEYISQYRLISLSNKVLPHLVSEQQSAFVKDSSGETRYMALKLDMRKAYDRKMDFGDTWMNLMMQCFHSLLRKVEENGEIRGDSICRSAPKLTHLFFCEKLLEILTTYEQASRQQINRDKTTLFFSKSTPQQVQAASQEALGVPVVKQYKKYLGLPSFIGRKKKDIFDNIKQRVWEKLQGWEGKLLSQAGREILIKAVAQALPTYTIFFWGQWEELSRFFPHCLIMEATCPSSASYAWKNIIKGRDVIKKGAVWRIVLSPRVGELAEAKVNSLIDEDRRCRMTNSINETLLNFEANMVKRIPLCCTKQPDELIWPHSANVICNLNVPSKVKNLIWRASKNSLPTKQNLVRRKILSKDYCDHCKMQHKDTFHALYLCPKLEEVWLSGPEPICYGSVGCMKEKE
ncbi:hypothetical protein ACB092_06G154000 [Castanea dentata]